MWVEAHRQELLVAVTDAICTRMSLKSEWIRGSSLLQDRFEITLGCDWSFALFGSLVGCCPVPRPVVDGDDREGGFKAIGQRTG